VVDDTGSLPTTTEFGDLPWFSDAWQELELRTFSGSQRHWSNPQRNAQEVAFLTRVLDLQPGTRLLDAPCGHGRHAVALAAHGAVVTAVDLSLRALEHTRLMAHEQGTEIRLAQADVRELPFAEEFDVVMNAGTSFGWFDDAGNQRVLDGLPLVCAPVASWSSTRSISSGSRGASSSRHAGSRSMIKAASSPKTGITTS
jgi:SAM-dependent methyltransferase